MTTRLAQIFWTTTLALFFLLISSASGATYTSQQLWDPRPAPGHRVTVTVARESKLPSINFYCSNVYNQVQGLCATAEAYAKRKSIKTCSDKNVKKFSIPLTYDWNSARARSRRTSAQVCGDGARAQCKRAGGCDGRWPLNTAGHLDEWRVSCDEFPFATSWEGGPSGGGKLSSSHVCTATREQSNQAALVARLGSLITYDKKRNPKSLSWKHDGDAHAYVANFFCSAPDSYAVIASGAQGNLYEFYGYVDAGSARAPKTKVSSWDPPGDKNDKPLPNSARIGYIYTKLGDEPVNPTPSRAKSKLPWKAGQTTRSLGVRKFNCPKDYCSAAQPVYRHKTSITHDYFRRITYEERATCDDKPQKLTTSSEQAAAAGLLLADIPAALSSLAAAGAPAAVLSTAQSTYKSVQDAVKAASALAAHTATVASVIAAYQAADIALANLSTLFDSDDISIPLDALTLLFDIIDTLNSAAENVNDAVLITQGQKPNDDGSLPAVAGGGTGETCTTSNYGGQQQTVIATLTSLADSIPDTGACATSAKNAARCDLNIFVYLANNLYTVWKAKDSESFASGSSSFLKNLNAAQPTVNAGVSSSQQKTYAGVVTTWTCIVEHQGDSNFYK